MPESPYFFVQKARKHEAIEALKYLRGKTAAGVQDELEFIQVTNTMKQMRGESSPLLNFHRIPLMRL